MPSHDLDLLILGAGWTSTFLIPLLQSHNLTFAATTRDGRKVAGADTIKWSFDPSASVTEKKNQFSSLPTAKHVLITFPLTGTGQSSTLIHGYEKAHGVKAGFIQLGSTGIWQIPRGHDEGVWVTRKTKYDTSNARAVAEDELLKLDGCVLNLAGLWGGERDARNWVPRVATTKEAVKGKKSVHLVHGEDVARGIVGVITREWKVSKGQRWMLTDGFVYDWWMLFARWADVGRGEDAGRKPSEQSRWVYELMREEGVRALPRSMETLGRAYDSREFWETYGLSPLKAGL
ncbi:unnamed protein product [Zymoseptoria tritici ST99CH_1A5]|uniref:NAD(P)-binding domain-containing protein n=4 Tax=Zymoseptoria tritici TaxID=1047171 RepID=F9WWG9_ZYMTI|nr:uncharacterized protein MYCGRDRAFT_65910 [Zymoseptoria tritici IPO323]SMQ45754.1 unnamed protein product [Zymoseptoria tritici ST99CH_3D7]SMR42099.1 unnamed protein product [Zymoseptoria tritici ST99CH_1E4]SMR44281.1 unnamed protein product [Zymoseptoria tritici ST99CH_3D1]SMY19435.1 unnamed protein product [Zymoseptoria tritici ST99CH_1A5]EGP91199.1 hypothetical protein MYCGRDRAFT_65910 [Zymoseptoria tritici IPO323]